MSGHLPWMDNLANFEYVEAQKKGFMSDVNSFLQRCFGPNDYPGKKSLRTFSKFVLLEIFTVERIRNTKPT